MDSRVVQSQVHENDEHHPRNVGSREVTNGAEERHYDPEKKSVLNKVRVKAKKIKDTIKKHGHHVLDHGHEYHIEDQHIPDDHDSHEDDGMVEEPEVHGAPTYESEAVKSATPTSEQVENLGKSGVNLESSKVMGEEPNREPRVVGVSPTTEINQNKASDPDRTFVEEEKPGQGKVNLEGSMGLEEVPHAPGSKPEAYTPPNYQNKVTDPTGAGTAEIDITPVEESFARMNVHDEPKPSPEPEVLPKVAETQYPSVGSHDQFVPGLSSATKTQYPSTESHDRCLPELSSETKKPSAASHGQFVPDPSTATTTQYPSAGSHDQFAPETISTSNNRYPENPEATGQTFNTTTTTVEEHPRYEPVEKPSNQSSYTDEISSVTPAIADKAASAENAVASKLGYGEKGDRDDKVAIHEEPKKSGDASNMSGSTAEHGKNIAQSLTEKFAPVYGKVAGVGSAMKSKVSGTRTGASTGVETETENGVKEQDKRVSVKEYLAEKLRPSEEDKALSEVISEALQLHKRKEEPTRASGDEDRDVTEVISDAIHKPEEEPVEKEHGHLGSGDEKSEKVSEESCVNSPGKGVVDKLKGVVGSWFGKSGGNQSSKVAGGEDLSKNKNSGAEVEQVSQAEDERRLQE